MEALHRRNKRNYPCDEDWKIHDQHVIQKIISTAGCRPPHWKSKENVRLCSTQQEMQKVLPPLEKHQLLDYVRPCRSISNLPFTYEEINDDEKHDPAYFRVTMTTADTTFKEITFVKDYSLQTLIGNTGGYLGLILGYAIIQLPVAVNGIVKRLRDLIASMKK